MEKKVIKLKDLKEGMIATADVEKLLTYTL